MTGLPSPRASKLQVAGPWLARSAKLALATGVVALCGGSGPSGPGDLPAPPADGVMGFILTAFAPAVHQGKDDCPEGLAGTVRENYLQSLPAPERTRLLQPASEAELTSRWKAYAVGADNTNICTSPELFDRPVQKTLQGKVAPGLDLEAGAVGEGCGHAEFTGIDGRAGVDNQAYRAQGCTRNYRGVDGTAGDIVKGYNNYLATGEHSMVLLLRGVDSLRRDDDVEIVFATTDDRPVLDSKRNFITGASFSVSDNPRWRNVMRGRIVDGVLTTDPADVRLTQRLGHGGIRGASAEWRFQRGRFELRFQSDGSVKGMFGGYQPIRNVIQSTILGGIGAATTAGIDCAAEYATLRKLADGFRDPASGQCTAISSALEVAAVPAFVIDTPVRASMARSD